MDTLDPRTVCTILEPHLVPRRRERLETVLGQRVMNLTVAIEDLHEPQNISAVVRTCEALGIQRVLVIEARNPYRANRIITQGSDQWLTIERHQSAHEALAWLRHNRFTVYASTLGDDSVPLPECAPFAERSALFFGNEHVGLSGTLRRLADHRFHLPMCGFSQSLNVTVAAGMALGEVLRSGFPVQPPAGEALWELRADWYTKAVPNARKILRESRLGADRRETGRG
jgi:tRNA (guanosine-2'-O-)-methyltransferase